MSSPALQPGAFPISLSVKLPTRYISKTKMKKALWFAVLGFIIAQSIPAETCDVTLDDNRETTVTQFCLSSLEKRFSTKGKLNFTLNGSVLLFTPLPENRQVEIKIHDDSDGLEAWANLANAFVDSIASESLPYEGKYSYSHYYYMKISYTCSRLYNRYIRTACMCRCIASICIKAACMGVATNWELGARKGSYIAILKPKLKVAYIHIYTKSKVWSSYKITTMVIPNLNLVTMTII